MKTYSNLCFEAPFNLPRLKKTSHSPGNKSIIPKLKIPPKVMRKEFFAIKPICLTLLCLTISFSVFSQGRSVQDCIGAIPICDRIYQEDNTYLGEGNIKDFDENLICMDDEQNSVWYTFQVNNTGKFGFLITPDDPNDDYDWALFDLTRATCADIQRDPARYLVSCNAAGGESCNGLTGATGATNFDVQGANCDNPVPSRTAGQTALNDLIDVQRGNIYALVINNWSNNEGSRDGYIVDFGLSSDIGIFDEEPPTVDMLDLVSECSGDEIGIQFSERIQCATINSSNFTLVGPNGEIPVTLFSQECENGFYYSDFFILRPETPISSNGDYTLTVNLNGATEALDLCNNPAIPNEYNIPNPIETPTVNLGKDVSACIGDQVIIEAQGVAGNSYRWSTGFTGGPSITVTEPGIYQVTVTTACADAVDEIEVTFTEGNPSVNLGEDRLLCPTDTIILDATTPGATYLWQNGANEATHVVDKTGTYAVTVTTQCGQATDRITFNFGQSNLKIDLGEDQRVCPSDEGVSLDASVLQEGAIYAWSDGFSEPTRNITAEGIYSVTVSTQCGSTSDDVEIDFIGDGDELVDLGEDMTICPGEEAILDATVPDASFQWDDGSITPQIAVSRTGMYRVTVTNECVSITDSVKVTVRDEAALDLMPDTTICEGDIITLDAAISGNNITYSWQGGQNTSSIEVDQSGQYTVTVTDDCGSVSGSITVAYHPPLSVELREDTVLCPGESFLLTPKGNATDFTWPDGSAGASFEVRDPGVYEITASNECEETTISVDVTECIRCEFYVPNAISPNGDGENDIFMPYTSSQCPITEYQLQIFDRWGTIIHQTNSLDEGWSGISSGEPVPEGVYVYVIKLNVEENGQSKPVSLSGDVIMMR